jgi:hypothetical protein
VRLGIDVFRISTGRKDVALCCSLLVRSRWARLRELSGIIPGLAHRIPD